MATTIYVTSTEVSTEVPSGVTGAAFKSEWEGTMAGGTVFHMVGWANVTGAPARPNTANVNKRIKNGGDTTTQERYGLRCYWGPLKVGQTYTGGQAIEAGIMGNHGATFGFHWLTVAIRIINVAGTISKEGQVIATGAGGIYASTNSYPATTAESRWDSGTSAATNYTTVAGDWLCAEFGCHYETASSLTLDFKTGDGNGSDITSTDSTTVRNPFFKVNDSLLLAPSIGGLMLRGVGA